MIEKSLNLLRIIFIAMIVGELVFLGVAMVVSRTQEMALAAETLDLLLYIALAVLVVQTIIAFVVRAVFMKKIAAAALPEKALELYFAGKLITSGLFEGGIFFLIVLIILGAHFLLPLILIAAGVMAQLMNFPSESQFRHWSRGDEGNRMELPREEIR